MALSAASAALACRRAFRSSIVLASHTVHVTIEAMIRPTITVFTTTSALVNIPHGDRSRGRTADASTGAFGSCALVAQGRKQSANIRTAQQGSKYLR